MTLQRRRRSDDLPRVPSKDLFVSTQATEKRSPGSVLPPNLLQSTCLSVFSSAAPISNSTPNPQVFGRNHRIRKSRCGEGKVLATPGYRGTWVGGGGSPRTCPRPKKILVLRFDSFRNASNSSRSASPSPIRAN